MKKLIWSLLLFPFFWSACNQDTPFSSNQKGSSPNALSLLKSENTAFKFERLQLYPIIASEGNIPTHPSLNSLKTLAEAMQKPGFRILERKQFGRTDEAWYHGLTVQNKTQDTVLLLSGEVVKGGNQDRVIAHHEVILPMTVRNIAVFCVEAGRSSYYNPQAPAAEKEAAAFTGYFSVASPRVRRAVQNSGNQQEVWDAVAQVTQSNHAESSTKTYTALDNESPEKKRRDAYLQHLGGLLISRTDVVGVVAVCGDQVLGVDVFGSPDLFRRQYPALLHGYVAEAAVASASQPITENKVEAAFNKVQRMTAPHAKSDGETGKFVWGDTWVHLFSK